ncbi:GNAT family N-acetyltransferase [Streptomyces sp. NPDC005386]|uniref:GNAT family N-acetyltransferase n=1 Tax=Streptomyces sp. NPDC005386 TaxID=3154562 RepID=UPI0033A75310
MASASPAVTIGAMQVAHLPDVLGLGHRAFDTAVKPYTGWSLSAVAAHFEASHPACFVALQDDALCGFVLGSITFEQRTDWGYLEWIAVAPSARGQGVAGRLVTHCRDRLTEFGATAVITDVEARNEASTTLMNRHGFQTRATVNLLVCTVTSAAAGDSPPHLSRHERAQPSVPQRTAADENHPERRACPISNRFA